MVLRGEDTTPNTELLNKRTMRQMSKMEPRIGFLLFAAISALQFVHAGFPNGTVSSKEVLKMGQSNIHTSLVINTDYKSTTMTPEEESSNESSSSSSLSANDTFPFDVHGFLTASLEEESEGNSEGDGLPPGAYYMQNATCVEGEDENCIIDHNITCVGIPTYCHLSYEDYVQLLYDYIYPSIPEWILIFSHGLVFLMGLVGNALVCIAVYTNHTMRTVTNIFIVNLAVADFFVILFCLPATVLWDVTETWFMGKAMCKGLIYFQTVSVTVSVLTLTFISLDRWYAICFPLRYVSTNKRAVCSIAFIWAVALLSDIPEFLALTTTPNNMRFGIKLFIQCQTNWDTETEAHFYITRLVTLYILPLLLMTVAYFQIVRVLWKSDTIPGHRESRNHQQYTCTYLRNPCPPANSSTMGQLRTRRKAAKMLVAVVIMFAGCFFPVHCLNILRYTVKMEQSQVITVFSLLSHWLCYANSAINPLIYNFMSGKFRREFKHALEKCRCGSTNRGRVEDRSMYHSAPATRFNNISPSSRSNYQLASMRDFTRQQTLQTSFIENGNHHQRLLQAQSRTSGGCNGTVNSNENGLGSNGNTSELLRRGSLPFSNDRVNGADLLAQPATVSVAAGGAENLMTISSNNHNGSSNSNSNQTGPP